MQGKGGSRCGHSLHPQATLLLSRIVLPLLYNACDAILYFFAVWAVSAELTTVPWWIKSGDYKNIQTCQIGFQEGLNQSKVKIAEKEALSYLEKDLDKEGGGDREEGFMRVNQGCFG